MITIFIMCFSLLPTFFVTYSYSHYILTSVMITKYSLPVAFVDSLLDGHVNAG